MKTISELLDLIKEKHGLKSDYKLALYMGIGGGNIANYRHGRSLPDENACEKIAAALGMDPDVLIAEMNATRAKSPEIRATWARIAHRLQAGMVHAAVMLCLAIVSLAGYAPNAEATALSFDKSACQSVYYV
jgi:transcriptional regulator with XRE-family HTH domain